MMKIVKLTKYFNASLNSESQINQKNHTRIVLDKVISLKYYYNKCIYIYIYVRKGSTGGILFYTLPNK